MRPTRLQLMGLVALFIVVVVSVAFAFAKTSADREAIQRTASSYTPAPLYASQPSQKPLTVAFIGDSYTAGSGVGSQAAWPTLLGVSKGWVVVNSARGGTGYLKGYASGGRNACGQDICPNYPAMVADVAQASPDVVIVSGGRNDGTKLTPDLGRNIAATFAALRKALPLAKIVALSPILAADDTATSFPEVKPAVRSAVEAVGGTYVDLGPVFGGHPELISADTVQPNADGQKVLADTVGRLLPPLR
ncbi:SGNH/GDSL hydrolase family protein [Sinomonas gamaensis]|uniref:SGNH/GDSL hydrolase family protein n=1 Tax=Sinomonas gamaensis TaxID=2565624 RepID=UPI00110813F2